jgi:hypothetical protein
MDCCLDNLFKQEWNNQTVLGWTYYLYIYMCVCVHMYINNMYRYIFI